MRLLLRGRARAAVVRQLKVPLGFGALLPHGPPAKEGERKNEANEQLGSDYGVLIARIEEELCIIECREGQEAANSSGRKEGVAYCWNNVMGETTAENRSTRAVPRAWRVSARCVERYC